MGLLAGKTAIITGGGQGIGEGICKNFAREGARVAVLGRTLSKVERVAKEIQSEGGEAFAVQCDVTDQAAVDHAISEIAAKYGGIDILVNNAMTQRLCPVEQATAEDLMDIIIHSTHELHQLKKVLFLLRGGMTINQYYHSI